MKNRLKYATIADIGVYNLIFYDSNREEELIQFCNLNGISFLPSKDRKCIYKLEDNRFTRQELSSKLCIRPYELIFSKDTLEKFNYHNHNEIHFIVEDDLIKRSCTYN